MSTPKNASRIEVQSLIIKEGECQKLSVFFGPHHFFEVEVVNGKTVARIGATHHGIQADASTVPSQLEAFIDEIIQAHPSNIIG